MGGNTCAAGTDIEWDKPCPKCGSERRENCGRAPLATTINADLLAALQGLVSSLSEQDDEGLIEHAEQMVAARAVIAKATGAAP